MPEDRFIYPEDGLSWELYHLAANAIARSGYADEVDVEDTLMLQLLTHELGILTLGAQIVARLYPELYPLCFSLNKKLIELTNAQEFFAESEKDSDGGPSNEGS